MNQPSTQYKVTHGDLSARLLSGLFAGLLGGGVMAVLLMAASAAEGQGFWFPMMQIAAVFFGLEALVGGAGVLLTGLLVHFATAAALGVGYGALMPRFTKPGTALFLGMFYALFEWALATYFILPSVNPVMSERLPLLPAAWFAGHLIYGTALAATPGLYKSLSRREETPEPVEYRFDQAA